MLQDVNRDSGAIPCPKISVKNYMSDEIGNRSLHRCLCLLIVALAVANPDCKIPDADECEQRSEETAKVNLAPLAEYAIDDQTDPMKRDVVSVPTDVPIL